jgi:hypothetical protein
MNNTLKVNVAGHVLIQDAKSLEIILDKKNAVHSQNMALAIGKSFAHIADGFVSKMGFGNGGSFFNLFSVINYRSPNVTGTDAAMYNKTYEVQVDGRVIGTPAANSVIALPAPAPSTATLIVVTAYLTGAEPVGQAVSDNLTTNPDATYVFDEISLLTSAGSLLTHVIFSPVEKTANRSFLITYTLTLSVS